MGELDSALSGPREAVTPNRVAPEDPAYPAYPADPEGAASSAAPSSHAVDIPASSTCSFRGEGAGVGAGAGVSAGQGPASCYAAPRDVALSVSPGSEADGKAAAAKAEPFDAEALKIEGQEVPLEKGAKSRSCTWRRGLCWTACILLLVLVILGIVALVIYLVFKPTAPTFDVSQFKVDNINLSSNLPQSADFFLSGLATYTITGTNPNKFTINYNYVNAAVILNNSSFANSSDPGSTVTVNGSATIDRFPLTAGTLVPTLLSTIGSGIVDLEVQVNAGANIKLLGITSPTVKVQMTCRLSVKVTNLGSADGIKQDCSSPHISL